MKNKLAKQEHLCLYTLRWIYFSCKRCDYESFSSHSECSFTKEARLCYLYLFRFLNSLHPDDKPGGAR